MSSSLFDDLGAVGARIARELHKHDDPTKFHLNQILRQIKDLADVSDTQRRQERSDQDVPA